jgi:prophage regulatory protein
MNNRNTIYKQKYTPYILRKPDVTSLTNISLSSLHNRINDGLMPPSISLGARAVGFIASEVYAVLDAMCQEQPPEQIRILVKELVENRNRTKGGV